MVFSDENNGKLSEYGDNLGPRFNILTSNIGFRGQIAIIIEESSNSLCIEMILNLVFSWFFI